MNVVAELQRLKEYREQLRQLAKPSFGRFEQLASLLLGDDAFEKLWADPATISEFDENNRILLFDYFIAIPLGDVIQCRGRFNSSTDFEELDAMEQQLQALIREDSLNPEDAELLPDLYNHNLAVPEDMGPHEKQVFDSIRSMVNGLSKMLRSPDVDSIPNLFKGVADIGRNYAVLCFINKQAGIYRSFEWEIIESILRSPYFPDFFEECEKEAGTPEIPYRYRHWPEREFFLKREVRGMGVEKYISNLHPDVQADFLSEEGYENFKNFMEQLAMYGKINNDANMEALLQLVTGYKFDGAARRLKWSGEDERVRILFFVVKYISTTNKGRYTILQKGSNVDFVGIEEGGSLYNNLINQYWKEGKCDPSRFLKEAKGIGDNVLTSLHSFYGFFPETREQA